MPGTGLPIPKNDNVLPQPAPVIGAGVYSTAQSWLNVAQSLKEEAAANEKIASAAASIGQEAGQLYQQEVKQAQVGHMAAFEVDWRAKKVAARDQFAKDPEGFKKWAEESTGAAIGETPPWMRAHAKRFLSQEFEGAYNSILTETRAEQKRITAQDTLARAKMAEEDVMAIASATGTLNSPEGKAALATYKGVLESGVGAGLWGPDHAQMMSENLSTQSQGAIIRKSVEQVYREKGFEAAREHLNQTITELGAPFRISDKIRTATLGWLRSEESGLRGERDTMSKEWAAAKPNLATLAPDVLQEMQQRAYALGAFKVGDDIQAHVTSMEVMRSIRQLPESDQMRILASGKLEARLTQRESSGDPKAVNQLGYAGLYQFGAPRLATLGVYTPGPGENLGAWSKTPANAPGKWTGTFNIPGHPDVKTLPQFLASPEAQKAAFAVHQQRTDQEIDRLGLGQYVGQTVGGVEITRDSLRAMIHLGGAEGARTMLASGGRINPADANGTTLLDYARLGSGSDLTTSRAGLLTLGMVRKDMAQGLTKQITDLRTAIGKTEFPPMEEIGALVAKVGALGNEEQKREVAEMAAQAEYGAKFSTLPLPQREEIKARWMEKLKTGANRFERGLANTVIATDRAVGEEWRKDPYGAAARFSEGIPALPAIDWMSPSAPQVLAAKVAQQNTIRADQNMGPFSVLRAGEAQQLAQTLVSGDTRAGSAILGMLAQNLPADMYKATIGDAPIKAALDGMVRSYDPDRLNTAMSVLDRAYRADPIGFKETFKEDTLRRLQTWQAHKDYLPPIAMAEHFKRTDDPAFAAARKHLEAEAEKKVASLKPSDVAYEIGTGWYGVGRLTGNTPAPPVDPLAANAMVAEYDKLFRERYVDTGDEGKAKQQAVERMRTVWGPSAVAAGALMRHPPERYYPQVDGSHDWMRKEVEGAIMASRLGADAEYDPAFGTGPNFTYKVLSDARTEADIAARRPPSYTVVVRDLQSGRDTIPMDWEGKPMRFSFDPTNAQAAAREQFATKRAAPDPFAGPVGEIGF